MSHLPWGILGGGVKERADGYMTNDTMDTLDKQKYTPGEMYMILAVLYFFPPQLEIFYFPQIQQG